MKKAYSTLIFMVSFFMMWGCDCDWNGGLVKNAQEMPLTIHGKVNNLTLNSTFYDMTATYVEVEIIKILKGEEDRKYITVWGNAALHCQEDLSDIQIGSEWIMSLYKIGNEEYEVSNCGEYITPVNENKTRGHILYNHWCSTEKPIVMSIDSLQLAIANPSKFIFPTKSCQEGETEYYVKANQAPRISDYKSLIEFLKENLNVKRDIRKKYEDAITFEIFVDETGNLENINYREHFGFSKKMKRKYGSKIIRLLHESSPWIPAKHHGENIPLKLIIEIKIEDLIKA